MLHVIALLTAKPGRRSTIVEAFRSNLPSVLAETGCLEYRAVIDVEDADQPLGPETVAVIEKWASAEDLRAHASAPHMREFGAAIRDVLIDRRVHVLSDI